MEEDEIESGPVVQYLSVLIGNRRLNSAHFNFQTFNFPKKDINTFNFPKMDIHTNDDESNVKYDGFVENGGDEDSLSSR